MIMSSKAVITQIGAIAAIVTCILTVASGQQAQQRQLQGQAIEIVEERLAEPEASDLTERLRQVDAAIVCRVRFSEVRAVRQRPDLNTQSWQSRATVFGGIPLITTESVVTVLEVLKGHPQMAPKNSVIRVMQPMGTTEWNGYTMTRRDGQAKGLEAGAEYVLMLKLQQDSNQFMVYGNDLFRVSNGEVETPSRTRYGVAESGKSSDEFLAKIRAAAAKLTGAR
jgi:hypothetical protein